LQQQRISSSPHLHKLHKPAKYKSTDLTGKFKVAVSQDKYPPPRTRPMPQQMLKYLSRMRRKQDLKTKARTLSIQLTVFFFESRRAPPATHNLSNLFVPCDLEKFCNISQTLRSNTSYEGYRTIMYGTVL
jgi:hypothetical protein